MKYKITWDTKELKDKGFTVHDLANHLDKYGCNIISFEGGSITFVTHKSEGGLEQEIKRVFGIKINFR